MNDTNDRNDSPWTRSEAQTRQTGRHWQRIRVLLGTIAAVLVVALLAGTLLTRMSGAPGQPNIRQPHYSPPKGVCAPGDISANLPANGEIYTLDMVSPDEGWAVGAIVDPTRGIPENGLILHYSHCSWAPVYITPPGVGLSSISMGSASDGWMLGSANSGAPLALHYSNGAWQGVSPAPGADLMHGGSYSSVRMLSANEGWIIFNHPKDSSGLGTTGLLHFSHGEWSEVETPFPVAEVVLPVSPNDAWVAGSASNSQEQFVLYHYHAGTWTKATALAGITIYTMHMVAPNEIWAWGQMERGSNRAVGAALHYDGSQWRQVAVGANGHPQDVEVFDQDTAWAFTQSEPTASATAPPGPPIVTSAQYQRDGVWSQVAWPFKNLTGIGQITRVSSDEYWAIGYHRVTNRTPTGNSGYVGSGHYAPVLLYFANGVWHEYTQ